VLHRDLVVALANQKGVPAVYGLRLFVTGGGLMSCSTDQVEFFRQAFDYVDSHPARRKGVGPYRHPRNTRPR
jgi:hypothetical protein